MASRGQPRERLAWTFSAELKHLFWKLSTRRQWQACILVEHWNSSFPRCNHLPTAAERSPAGSVPSLLGRGCGPQAQVSVYILPTSTLPAPSVPPDILPHFLPVHHQCSHGTDKLDYQLEKMWSFSGPRNTLLFIPDPENGYRCQQDSRPWEQNTQNPGPQGAQSCCSSPFILPRVLTNCHMSPRRVDTL